MSGGRARRLHLLASVISDEVRYVNPIAAGKWRAGRARRPGVGDAAREAAQERGGAGPGRARLGGWTPAAAAVRPGTRPSRFPAGLDEPPAFPLPPAPSAAARLRTLPTPSELGTSWKSLTRKKALRL